MTCDLCEITHTLARGAAANSGEDRSRQLDPDRSGDHISRIFFLRCDSDITDFTVTAASQKELSSPARRERRRSWAASGMGPRPSRPREPRLRSGPSWRWRAPWSPTRRAPPTCAPRAASSTVHEFGDASSASTIAACAQAALKVRCRARICKDEIRKTKKVANRHHRHLFFLFYYFP